MWFGCDFWLFLFWMLICNSFDFSEESLSYVLMLFCTYLLGLIEIVKSFSITNDVMFWWDDCRHSFSRLMHGTFFRSISCMELFSFLSQAWQGFTPFLPPPPQVQLQTKKDGNIGALAQAKIIIRFWNNKDLIITLKQIQYLNLKGLRVSLPSTTGCQRR